MSITQSKNIFQIPNRYLRSANLERDWHDQDALDNYIVTQKARETLQRIQLGLTGTSSLRAWRITGDYGSGKSSFALYAAKSLAETDSPNSIGLPKMASLLITGSRTSMSRAILMSINAFVEDKQLDQRASEGIRNLLKSGNDIEDTFVLKAIRSLQKAVAKAEIADGLAIFIDEAGKFLEHTATRPEQEDIFLLQSLAEMASRSGNNPLLLVTIFHQGLNAYADRLTKTSQKEWEKIAGRFEEITWHHPTDQVALMISAALNSDLSAVDQPLVAELVQRYDQAIEMGWFGYHVDRTNLIAVSQNLFPLDPFIIPVLIRLFSNYGQNERSLFSFLIGSEDFGLQEFVSKTKGKKFYELHDLYDFTRANFGQKLGSLNYYWKTIEETITNHQSTSSAELDLLKTIGLLNLINSDTLIPSQDVLLSAVADATEPMLNRLRKNKTVYLRGQAGGFCIWSNTSINIEDSYNQAIVALGPAPADLKSTLQARITTRPLVARRHYIETGNLRYFEVRYVDSLQPGQLFSSSAFADGLIVVPLCQTQLEVDAAKKAAEEYPTEENTLFLIPSSLQYLGSYLEEVRRWEWVERSVGELRHDRPAREEVSRLLAMANFELQKQLDIALGFDRNGDHASLGWYYHGERLPLANGRMVMGFLADVCDAVYTSSPSIHNELINRKDLSAAAASARLRLCERLFEYSNQPFLGMDPEKHPPEMSMYLSVLSEAGFHQENADGNWQLSLPEEDYDAQHCRILPAMRKIEELLSTNNNQRMKITQIMDVLKQAPFGLRDGLIPLLLAIFIVINEQSLALYEDGSFVPRVSGSNYLRLIKAPETFHIQYYPINGLRTSLFTKISKELGIAPARQDQVLLLDIIKPLFVFMAQLPEYVSNSGNLDPRTQKVRNNLKVTRDPVNLLFQDLPVACDLQPLENNIDGTHGIDEFVTRLKSALDELRSAYPSLLEKLLSDLIREFGLSGTFEDNRESLAQRGKALAAFVTDIRLKSYCLRLADTNLNPSQWAESLANLLCAMPASKWRDRDIYKFEQELHQLTQQFQRVEATVYSKNGAKKEQLSVRVALTRPDGSERDQVVHLSTKDAKAATALEAQLLELLEKQGQIGIAAASSALWAMLSKANKD